MHAPPLQVNEIGSSRLKEKNTRIRSAARAHFAFSRLRIAFRLAGGKRARKFRNRGRQPSVHSQGAAQRVPMS
eukprot:1835245-Pyramimonas_sp.AAC.1